MQVKGTKVDMTAGLELHNMRNQSVLSKGSSPNEKNPKACEPALEEHKPQIHESNNNSYHYLGVH